MCRTKFLGFLAKCPNIPDEFNVSNLLRVLEIITKFMEYASASEPIVHSACRLFCGNKEVHHEIVQKNTAKRLRSLLEVVTHKNMPTHWVFVWSRFAQLYDVANCSFFLSKEFDFVGHFLLKDAKCSIPCA
ncbi:hypothetical protein [Anaplasma phagocytophilum]|nr:hypothetical protein [Anaplasma phagocytophilum]